MVDITPFTNKVNMIGGVIVALLSYIFGEHWMLFAALLILNCLDFLTRWIVSRLLGTEKSSACWHGILKKLGYWAMVALAFIMGAVFIEIGSMIGMKLDFTMYLGWLTLSALIINEIRSILENLVEGYGDKVPRVLVKGLEAANKAIEKQIDMVDDDTESEE